MTPSAPYQQYGPPLWVDKKALAYKLSRSESTIDDMVKRGVIPQPIRPPGGAPLWRLEDVDRALLSYAPSGDGDDPITRGIRNAAQASKGSREPS